jgi:hypothetical protein
MHLRLHPLNKRLMTDSRDTRVRAIDEELERMKGAPKFNALPSGYYNKTFFTERFADFVHARNLHVELMESLERKRKALAPEAHKELAAVERARLAAEYQFGERKNTYMGFLESTQPIDANAYLAKKHALLDEKIALLEQIRMDQVEQT